MDGGQHATGSIESSTREKAISRNLNVGVAKLERVPDGRVEVVVSVAVRDSKGKVVMESILETKASTILEFFAGLRGTLSVTLEEGTWAAWLYDLLKPHVARVVVCNPRKNALLKHGNKNDRIDASLRAKYFSSIAQLTVSVSRLEMIVVI